MNYHKQLSTFIELRGEFVNISSETVLKRKYLNHQTDKLAKLLPRFWDKWTVFTFSNKYFVEELEINRQLTNIAVVSCYVINQTKHALAAF